MKFVSIDIETTGLDPDYCLVLEIAAILADLDGNVYDSYHTYVNHKVIVGTPYALAMNAEIIKTISELTQKKPEERKYQLTDAKQIAWDMRQWLFKHFKEEKITLAGKNFSNFDRRFLDKLGVFGKNNLQLHIAHRDLDPGVLFLKKDVDNVIPDLQTCYDRAGLGIQVAHTAMDDAMGVVKLLEVYFKKQAHNENEKKEDRGSQHTAS